MIYNSHFLSMIKSLIGLTARTITAGATGDNAAQNGTTIDRQAYSQNAYAAIVVVPVTAVLTAEKTATVAVKLQDSADGTTWADYQSAASLVLTGDETTGSTETGSVEIKANLEGADRYIRAVVTCDLNATGTDTATFAAVVALAGSVENPMA